MPFETVVKTFGFLVSFLVVNERKCETHFDPKDENSVLPAYGVDKIIQSWFWYINSLCQSWKKRKEKQLHTHKLFVYLHESTFSLEIDTAVFYFTLNKTSFLFYGTLNATASVYIVIALVMWRPFTKPVGGV